MKTIKDILYEMFSVDAIKAAALSEQLEDIKYCTENNMNHLKGGTERKNGKNVVNGLNFMHTMTMSAPLIEIICENSKLQLTHI